MSGKKRIQSALLSVFYKDGLEPIARKLHENGVTLYSTGGTQTFLEGLGLPVIPVESQTDYPSIFGGRVKTLHPAIFGGILHRRDNESDLKEKAAHNIPDIDMVVVDLYPFEETVASGASEQDIVEKIDIGGISLIRAAAKNFKDVLIVPSREYYAETLELLNRDHCETETEDRFRFAGYAFDISSHYDTAIHGFFAPQSTSFKRSIRSGKALRYGENPHQQGWFHGDMDEAFEQLHGKELSYNNLLDVDAAAQLISEFWSQDPTVAVIKHNNACGIAQRSDILTAWTDALAGDPVSAFGGIIASNREIDGATAEKIHEIFFEVILAPGYSPEAMEILQQKKNRIILRVKNIQPQEIIARTALNGMLVQERDHHTDSEADLKTVTNKTATPDQINDLLFASAVCKNTKSNTIVLVKDRQLLASGTGQTSRVDALRQAIQKAKSFNFDLNGAVMASDAFFPFPDCVEIAHGEGIDTVIQPGGSIKDQLSIDYCDANDMAMVFTGHRHFKH